eukprot:2812959-Amphidinium_carterae.1
MDLCGPPVLPVGNLCVLLAWVCPLWAPLLCQWAACACCSLVRLSCGLPVGGLLRSSVCDCLCVAACHQSAIACVCDGLLLLCAIACVSLLVTRLALSVRLLVCVTACRWQLCALFQWAIAWCVTACAQCRLLACECDCMQMGSLLHSSSVRLLVCVTACQWAACYTPLVCNCLCVRRLAFLASFIVCCLNGSLSLAGNAMGHVAEPQTGAIEFTPSAPGCQKGVH